MSTSEDYLQIDQFQCLNVLSEVVCSSFLGWTNQPIDPINDFSEKKINMN